MSDYPEYRSRSRSPSRRRLSVDDGMRAPRGGYGDAPRGRDRRYEDYRGDFRRGGYGGRRGSSRGRGFGGYRGYGAPPPRMGGRGFGRRGGYGHRPRGGPMMAREMEPPYEEKIDRNYDNSIFIGNLSFDATPEDLHDFFGQAGEVLRADIITSRGRHRGMGTVEFTSPEGVDNAIRDFNGVEFMGRPLFVRQDNPPPEPMESLPPMRERFNDYPPEGRPPMFEVFIVNLPYSMTWQTLKDLFREAGDVIRADIELDRNGFSRGFGTVFYGTQEEMFNAIERFNGFDVDGRILQVREGKNSTGYQAPYQAPPPPQEQEIEMEPPTGPSQFTENVVGGGERSTLIYCSNLPLTTATGDLYDLFETIGRVRHAELKFDESGAPTGIAVIEYENVEDADFCIQRLNNYNYGGCDLDISYSKYL